MIPALIGLGWWVWANGESESQHAPVSNKAAAAEKVAVRPIIRHVERLRGLRFRRRLTIVLATPSKGAALIGAASEREYPRRKRLIDEEQLKLLGLLEASVDLERVLRTVDREEVLGFYDTHTKQLVVIRGPGEGGPLQEITLAHELDHALEDQRFDIPDTDGLTDDRAIATSALFEGTATALMADYAERYMDLGDIASALGDVSRTDVKLPRFVERELLFPYEQGERFADAFRQRGTWRAIDQVLRLRRPSTTEQILHPEKYAIDERPAAIDLASLGKRLGGGWRRLTSAGIGEFDLDSLFRLVGKVKGERAAAGWGGGRFDFWRRKAPVGCRAPCIDADVALLVVAWDTVRDRKEGELAFTRMFERGLKGIPIRGHRRIRLWSSRGGVIGMSGTARSTRVIFAPSWSLAIKLVK